jgi:hypothetical protein
MRGGLKTANSRCACSQPDANGQNDAEEAMPANKNLERPFHGLVCVLSIEFVGTCEDFSSMDQRTRQRRHTEAEDGNLVAVVQLTTSQQKAHSKNESLTLTLELSDSEGILRGWSSGSKSKARDLPAAGQAALHRCLCNAKQTLPQKATLRILR